MKWSSVAGLLLTAPLALAATLKADLVERNMAKSEMKCSSSSCSDGYSTTIVVQEVTVIWVNYGGGSKTTTINAASSAMGGAQATHTVGSLN
jgi:hypothetical protein